MHLVDTTLFYSPTSGGVRRYLNAKHAWYQARGQERHSLLVPGDRTALQPGDVSTIAGLTVPGTFNYRLPLAAHRWASLLDELQPDIIEAGDAFHRRRFSIRICRGWLGSAAVPSRDGWLAAICAGCTSASTWCSRPAA